MVALLVFGISSTLAVVQRCSSAILAVLRRNNLGHCEAKWPKSFIFSMAQ